LIVIILDRSGILVPIDSFNFCPDVLDIELLSGHLIFNVHLLSFLLVILAVFFVKGMTLDVDDCLSVKLFLNENNGGDVFV
jgi:hypothetical protein